MYLPGEGIGYHKDDPLLGDPVSIFGSQSDTTIFSKNPSNGDSFCIRLFARSLLVLTRAARHEWHHGIPRRREDEVVGLTVPRTTPRLETSQWGHCSKQCQGAVKGFEHLGRPRP